MSSQPDNNGIDFTELADNTDELREALRVMVAGLMADGFTDREAHHIIASIFTLGKSVSGNDDEEESA